MHLTRLAVVQDETSEETGAEDWLAAAVAAHARRVYGIAYRVLRNTSDAEDCVQEVFLRVWRFRSHRERIADEAAWLARIAWRTAFDRRERHAAVPLDETLLLRSRGLDPEKAASEREVAAWMEQLVWTLPRKLRDPLIMSTWGEMDATEIAAMLGTSAASVRSRLLRARQFLKGKILKQMEKKAGHEQAG